MASTALNGSEPPFLEYLRCGKTLRMRWLNLLRFSGLWFDAISCVFGVKSLLNCWSRKQYSGAKLQLELGSGCFLCGSEMLLNFHTLCRQSCRSVQLDCCITFCLRSSLWLQFKPHQIAAGIAYLTAKLLNMNLDSCLNIWREFQTPPPVLQDVSQQLMEVLGL